MAYDGPDLGQEGWSHLVFWGSTSTKIIPSRYIFSDFPYLFSVSVATVSSSAAWLMTTMTKKGWHLLDRQEAQAKLNGYHEAQGSHGEVYTDGSKMNEIVGAAAVINRHFQNGETTCHQLSKDCQTTAPSSQLRPQPSVWCWTITNTWAQSITT